MVETCEMTWRLVYGLKSFMNHGETLIFTNKNSNVVKSPVFLIFQYDRS